MKNNFNTSIDLGSSKIRLGITDKKNLNKNFYTEKDCISNLRIKDFNIIKSKEIVHDLIKKSEKEFGKHIDNINLMVDTPDIFSIDLSIKKKFEKKKINTEDISHSILEAKLLIQKNYKKKKNITYYYTKV